MLSSILLVHISLQAFGRGSITYSFDALVQVIVVSRSNSKPDLSFLRKSRFGCEFQNLYIHEVHISFDF